MNKIYLLVVTAFTFAFTMNSQVEYEENFEIFTLGDISAQHPNWRTWSGLNGGLEDADVVDTQSNSGVQSLWIDDSEIMDQIVLVPSAPNSGLYTISWQMLVPTGQGGYFNMQAVLTPAVNPWIQALMGGNVYFNCDGSSGGSGGVTGVIDCSVFIAAFTYPEDEWFLVTCVYDLDNEVWAMSINGNEQFNSYPFVFGATIFTELAGINFFSATPHNEFYVDDLVMMVGVLGADDFSADVFSVYPNPVTDLLNIHTVAAVDAIAIYDVLGKLIIETAPDTISPSIDMSALTSGVYIVKVTIGDASKTVKVIK